MHLRLVFTTAMYLASVSAVMAAAINPTGTAKFLRRYSLRVAAAVKTVSANEPVVAASEISARPMAAQSKSRALQPGQYRVPAGYALSARLRKPIDSRTAQATEQIDAILTAPVTQDGVELIPNGSIIHGSITDAQAATKRAPLGHLEMTFTVVLHAETQSRAAIRTRPLAFTAEAPPQNAVARALKRQPIDVVLPAGHPIVVTLSEPVLVYIPGSSRS